MFLLRLQGWKGLPRAIERALTRLVPTSHRALRSNNSPLGRSSACQTAVSGQFGAVGPITTSTTPPRPIHRWKALEETHTVVTITQNGQKKPQRSFFYPHQRYVWVINCYSLAGAAMQSRAMMTPIPISWYTNASSRAIDHSPTDRSPSSVSFTAF